MDKNRQQEKRITDIAPIQMSHEKLVFPVTYPLKAVMTAALSDAENKQQLIHVFNKLGIKYLYQRKNKSKKGAYVSFTYEVTLSNRHTMNRLYALLKEIRNLKFAL